MPLPQLRYFFLSDVAARWQTSPEIVLQHALEDLIEISIMVVGIRVQVGYFEEVQWTFCRVMEDELLLSGPQPLCIAEVWKVLRDGAADITGFKPKSEGGYVDIIDPSGSVRCVFRDLLITRAERDRFELEHKIVVEEAAAPDVASGVGSASAITHSAAFEHVSLGDQSYRFGPRQAAIVRKLYEASQLGDPWVPAADLLASAGCRSSRLVDLFKSQKHWKRLIRSDGKGRYRLAEPQTRRAFRRANVGYPKQIVSQARDIRIFRKQMVGIGNPTTSVPPGALS